MNPRWHKEPSERLTRLKAAVIADIRDNREKAYRRALQQAGFMPQSVDIMVARDRRWIEWGER